MQRKTLINFILALSLTCLALPALAQLSEIDQSGLKVQPDLFARDSLRIDSIVCPFRNEVDYEPGDIECGLLEVPENRERRRPGEAHGSARLARQPRDLNTSENKMRFGPA